MTAPTRRGEQVADIHPDWDADPLAQQCLLDLLRSKGVSQEKAAKIADLLVRTTIPRYPMRSGPQPKHRRWVHV